MFIRTHHAVLQWLKRFRERVGQHILWLELLEESDSVLVHHRSGVTHGNADALSCHPRDRPRCCRTENDVLSKPEVKTVSFTDKTQRFVVAALSDLPSSGRSH